MQRTSGIPLKDFSKLAFATLEGTMQTTGGAVIDGLTQMFTLHATVLTYKARSAYGAQ